MVVTASPSCIGDYIPLKTLGAGATGKVKLARHVRTAQLVALKIVRKSLLDAKPHLLHKLHREIAILKLLAENWRHVQQIALKPLSSTSSNPQLGIMTLLDVYETHNSFVLVLEYCQGGELFDKIIEQGHFPEPQLLDYFQQLVYALHFCHNRGVCHRDLKPENLLLTTDNIIKLADFGMATLLTPGAFMETSCGSAKYCAPEVLMGEPYDGCAADIWSLGVVLFAMATAGLPFDDDNFHRLVSKIQSGAFCMPPDVPEPVADLIHSMIVVDASKRISITEIKQLPWFTSRQPRTSIYEDINFDLRETLAVFGDRPIVDPNPKILRYLADLELGDYPTIRRRLASEEPSLERDFYYQFEGFCPDNLNFREVASIPLTPLGQSTEDLPTLPHNISSDLVHVHNAFPESTLGVHSQQTKVTVRSILPPMTEDSQKCQGESLVEKHERDGALSQRPPTLHISWFPPWQRFVVPAENAHECSSTAIQHLASNLAHQPVQSLSTR